MESKENMHMLLSLSSTALQILLPQEKWGAKNVLSFKKTLQTIIVIAWE